MPRYAELKRHAPLQGAAWAVLALGLALALPAAAQHAIAPSGYYPDAFTGDIFTGVVTATDDATGSITLLYTDSGKVERFTGQLPQPFVARGHDGNLISVTPALFPHGTGATVFYIKHAGGQNEIFLVKVGKTAILNARYRDLTFMAF